MLETLLKEIGFSPTDRQLNQLNLFYQLLVEKNKVMNLTAITEYKDVVVKHFADSVLIRRVQDINEGIASVMSGKGRVIDMGTGAGFPGIPLAIMYPELDFVLMDSLRKRIGFLDEVIVKLGLDNVVPIHARAEDAARKTEYREAFDLAVSRAVAKTPVLSEYCLPYVKKGGYFVPYKSSNAEAEVRESAGAIRILGGDTVDIYSLNLTGTDDTVRLMPVIKKINSTDKKYPRAGGKPDKEPLR